jgi:hypothetical protein
MRSVKKDKFLRKRDNISQVIRICCAKCGKVILVYQKNGRGALRRLYSNRILTPENLSFLQDNVESVKQLKPLVCECKNVIGVPMLHWEGRLAFRLINGTFTKEQHKGELK